MILWTDSTKTDICELAPATLPATPDTNDPECLKIVTKVVGQLNRSVFQRQVHRILGAFDTFEYETTRG